MGQYYDEVKKLQGKNSGKIVIVKSGIFYTALGKDALVINKIFGNKLLCFKEGVCKCRNTSEVILEKSQIN